MNTMTEGVIVKNLTFNRDDRGWLTEIYRNDETKYRPAMSYVSQTMPGVVRGPHEHKMQSDCFVFLFGKFRLFLWDNRKGATNFRKQVTYDVGEHNPMMVIIPPGVVHAYKCISETPGVIVNLPDKLYAGKAKREEVDEIRWEAMPDSPFKVE